jgi:glycosyltransferase involved in cell wall biosynthesis
MTTSSTRVCILNPFGYELFDPAARASKVFGGAEVQLYYLALALAEQDGISVSMIVEHPDTEVESVREGVEMITVPREGRYIARLRGWLPVPSLAYLAAMRRADADVYLQRGGALLTGDVALHCRLARRHFAFMAAHDWDCDRHHQRGWQYLPGSYYAAALRRADLVCAQSEFQRSQLERHHGVPSMVQRTAYPDATGADAGLREHVLWAARCLDWKRPMAFLDLAEGRPDVPFVMACAPYDGARATYDAVAARASSMPNVQFLGFVPFADTEDLFRHARVVVNSSTAEGFPNTFVQAARVGTPVLSLEVNPDGILQLADFGACADGDPAQLARQLDTLLDDCQVWHRQSANAYKYFRQEHDIEDLLPAFMHSLRALRRR